MFILREAQPADAAIIAELESELFPDNWMSESTVLNELERGPVFVAATPKGELLGYAITHWRNRVLDLLRLGVSSTYRRRGLGAALLARVLRVPHSLCVLTVRRDNIAAITLYKRNGFRLHGTTPESLVLVRTSPPPTHGHMPCT